MELGHPAPCKVIPGWGYTVQSPSQYNTTSNWSLMGLEVEDKVWNWIHNGNIIQCLELMDSITAIRLNMIRVFYEDLNLSLTLVPHA